jgi:hypothetical protein
MSAQLRSVAATFGPDGIRLEVRYTREADDAPATRGGTRRRLQEGSELAREGLSRALEALESGAGVESIGHAGFESRVDWLTVAYPTDEKKKRRSA